MKFTELKDNIKNLLKNRRQDHFNEISQDDMHLVEKTIYDVPKKTILCLGLLISMKHSLRFFHLPKLLVNPLGDIEGLIYKKKLWSKIMSNHLVFIGTMSCFLIHAIKYEAVKFYLFLKYENLVHSYMDALDRRQMIYLNKAESVNNSMNEEKKIEY